MVSTGASVCCARPLTDRLLVGSTSTSCARATDLSYSASQTCCSFHFYVLQILCLSQLLHVIPQKHPQRSGKQIELCTAHHSCRPPCFAKRLLFCPSVHFVPVYRVVLQRLLELKMSFTWFLEHCPSSAQNSLDAEVEAMCFALGIGDIWQNWFYTRLIRLYIIRTYSRPRHNLDPSFGRCRSLLS